MEIDVLLTLPISCGFLAVANFSGGFVAVADRSAGLLPLPIILPVCCHDAIADLYVAVLLC
jgi:hypothetical protein